MVGGRRAGLARGPHPVLSLQLEQRGRLQKSVAKEVSGRACSPGSGFLLGGRWGRVVSVCMNGGV